MIFAWDVYLNVHPRVNAALKEVLARRQPRYYPAGMLNHTSGGNVCVEESARALRNWT